LKKAFNQPVKVMKSKIAFISEHASPLACAGGVDSGGQNVYVRELALELAERDFEIDIYTRRDSAVIKQVVDWMPGVRIIYITAGPAEYIPKEELMPFMKKFSSNMIRFIQREKIQYDLVHANFWMSGMVAMDVKAQLGIPFVITFHALGLVRAIHQKEADKFPKERMAIEREIMFDANAIIAECPQDQNDMKLLYGISRDKTKVVPCGFNPEEFYPVEKEKARKYLGLPNREKILLQLGRMVPRKGIDNVIRAMKYLQSDLQPVRLLVVGGDKDRVNGPCAAEFRRLKELAVKEGVAARVTFIGPKQHRELRYYYSASDVFISTPWYEPFGITPLESMACGTPVIGSDVGGIKYSVVDGVTGYLVPPKSPRVLAWKINKILKNRQLFENMSVACLERANERFTWSSIAEEMMNVYLPLIQMQHLYQDEKTLRQIVRAS
jgi:glycosyltransferase involved in cell wall biosynthesis